MTLNPVIPLHARIPEWTFAERLRKARRDVGWTQTEMAARLEVKASTYEAWETGRNRPDLTTLAEQLEEVTGISRLWFVGWVEAAAPNGPDDGGGGGGTESPLTSPLSGSNGRPSLYNVAALSAPVSLEEAA